MNKLPVSRRLLIALVLGLWTLAFAGSATPAVASETAGIVFFAKKTSVSSTELWGAKADGTEPFSIHSAKIGSAEIRDPSLSPDGKSVAIAYANNIGVINVKTGEVTVAYNGSGVPKNPNASHPRWSPSGERLIFVGDVSASSTEAARGHMYIVKSNGTSLEKLEPVMWYSDMRVKDPSFSPSGRRITFAGFPDNLKAGHIYTARSDGSDVQSVMADPLPVFTTSQLRSLSYSPDGTSILFVRAGEKYSLQVHRVPSAGGSETQLTSEEEELGANEDPSWLPSGATIAYSAPEGHIKTMTPTGGSHTRLTTEFYSDYSPSYKQPEHDEALENEELLEEYRPELRYDSSESYLADSPAEMTDLWGSDEGIFTEGENEYDNNLWEGAEEKEIASTRPMLEPGWFPLSLEALGPEYPSEFESDESDWINERNEHYAEDAEHLEEQPGYENQTYAQAVADPEGNLWLQYWFFYYYDDSSFLFLSTGSHEGDWEMMMVKLNTARNPVEVVFAQHEDGAHCEWNEVEHFGTTPVGYVAVGTHATYPFSGAYTLPSGVPENDHANGEGEFRTPSLNVINESNPSWVAWQGRWGGTTAGALPGEATSPHGPAYIPEHSQWSDPDGFAEGVADCYERYWEEERPAARGAAVESVASPEIVRAFHRGNRVMVDYRLSKEATAKNASLLLSLNPAGGRNAPLTTAIKHPHIEGTTKLPFKIGPNHGGTVLLSLIDGRDRSPTARAEVE